MSIQPGPESLRTGIFLGLTPDSFDRLRGAIHVAIPRVKQVVSAAAVDWTSIGPRIPGFTIVPESKLREALGDSEIAEERLERILTGLGNLAGGRSAFSVRLGQVRTTSSMGRPLKHRTLPDGRPPARANITAMVDPTDTGGLTALSEIGAAIGGVLAAEGLSPELARSEESAADHMAVLEYDRVKGGKLTDRIRDDIAGVVGETLHEFGADTVMVGAIVLGANARQPVLDNAGNPALWPLAGRSTL